MDVERWQKIKEIFNAVVELPLNRRAQFLAEACGNDELLYKEIELLLLSDERANSFIEESAFDITERAVQTVTRDSLFEQRFGPYRLKREIGRGGMGAVFLAERADDEFKKKVAVKILKVGLETDEAIMRFRRERQILAELEHPNIAHLLDGGTMAGGLPFYVMEYIEGKPLDEYCDQNNLTIKQRLKLFLSVCNAVHYAHQKHIVHRDIKPGNILVLDDGTPKLLDFGIAKLLDTEFSKQNSKQTATAWRLMTPDYASPEQIRGEEITTATDIYSLGVLLYELLTGHLPYRLKNHFIYEIARAICEQEPEKPSTSVSRIEETTTDNGIIKLTPEKVSCTREGTPEKLRRRLKGDLDHITLMALRKELEERYSSVEDFAKDIRHYLKGMPISSRKGSFTYKVEKFIRHNKMRIAVAVFVLGIIFTGVFFAIRQTRLVEMERLRAAEIEAERRKLVAASSPDYIFIGDNPSLRPRRAITISAWFKTSRASYAQFLVSKFESNSDSQSDDSYALYLGTQDPAIIWQVETDNNGKLLDCIWLGVPHIDIFDEQFHHVIGTYDSETEEMKAYLDGVRMGGRYSQKPKGLIVSTTTNFLLGAKSQRADILDFLKGTLDEVQVYDRAISESEVQLLYNSPETSLPGLISKWSGEGNAQDSFGNNHGKIIGEVKFEKGIVGQAFSFRE